MSSIELPELHEWAQHAKHEPDDAQVSLTMAILAVVVAAISLLGHRTHTEEIVLQNKVTDGWAYYQAKTIRRHTDQALVDMNSYVAVRDPQRSAKFAEKYTSEAERYRDEQKQMEAETRKLQSEQETARKSADRFDLGEVFLEIALVITSITLMAGRRAFWYAGMLLGLTGVVVAASSFLIH
jgi:hypothetical protein